MKAGCTRLTTPGFHKKDYSGRIVMQARVLINGTSKFDHTGSYCHIRDNSNGDRNSVSNHSMHSLNAGDTIEVLATHESGPDLYRLTEARCAVQKLA